MKVILALVGYLVLCKSTPPKIPPARFDDFKVYRLNIEDEQQLKELHKLTSDYPIRILDEIKGIGRANDVVIDPTFHRKFELILKYLEFSFVRIIDDLQSALEQQQRVAAPTDDLSNISMNWTHYHNVPVIYDWLDNLAAENPHLITSYIAGYSYERKPIKAVKVSARRGNKAIFIESNIHAIEWISSATTTCFLNKLIHSADKELNDLLNNYDWIFLPVLNPDGLVYTHTVNRLWRKNRKPTGYYNESGLCFGTDLNRNFDVKWGVAAYNFDVPCDHWYAGKKSNTEEEVKTLVSFLDTFNDDYIRMYLAFHSYGNLILLPYGHTTEEFPPNYDKMMKVAGAYANAATVPYGTKFKFGASGILNYKVSGSSKDYAYGVKNIPFTATMELRDNGTFGFFLPPNQILDVCHEVTVGLKAMIKKAREEGFFD